MPKPAGPRSLSVVSAVVTALALSGMPAQRAAAEPLAAPTAVPSTLETERVLNTGDAADDPAIWAHPTDPALSLLIGNDKKGALETYDMTGRRLQRITTATTFWGNVDVRGGHVAAWNGRGVRVFTVDVGTRLLVPATDTADGVIRTPGEGLCLYQPPSPSSDNLLHVVAISRSGVLRQLQLSDLDGDGLLEGKKVRELAVGSEAEGCVVDDASGALYVSQEDVALWRYDIDPSTSTRTVVDTVTTSGGRIAPDAEGVTLADELLIVSAQNVADPTSSYFAVYDRVTNVFVATFRVTAGAESDDCDQTDGITAYSGDLGPAFPSGAFVCQDGRNGGPGSYGTQNFKLVPWESVRAVAAVPPPLPR